MRLPDTFGTRLLQSIAVAALAGLVVWLTIRDSHAEPLTQAVRLSNLPPAPPPEIRVVDLDTLRALACRDPARCAALGLFREGVIYVTADAPPAVVVHEMVHYLQWVQAGDAWDCREWARREHQAYQVQIMALEAEGGSTLSVSLGAQMVTCR